MLRASSKVILQTEWDGRPADILIALHAFRSAGSIARFRERFPERPIALMLTGTDIYGDMGGTAEAARSLERANRLVLLQEDAMARLAPPLRAKAEVIFQSAEPLPRKAKPRGRLDCVAAGHLRAVKDPATLFAAMRLLPPALPIYLRHFGAALDEGLGQDAAALQAQDARYRYHGAQPHARVRAAIQSAHLLVHPSLAEGGANVIVEAVTAATPVIASRVPGNVGMLGKRYSGYFEPGDARALARMLRRALEDPQRVAHLRAQCAERRPLFRPIAEERAVRRLVARLIAQGGA